MTEKGSGAILWEAPTVEIAGRSYQLKRLGYPQVAIAAKIYAAASAYINRAALAHIDQLNADAIGTFIIDAMAHAVEEVYDLLASVLGVAAGLHADKREKVLQQGGDDPNKGTIRDPDIFPFGSELVIIEALASHKDIDAFLASAKSLGKSPALKKLTQPLKRRSTASKKGMGGRIKKS